MSLDHLLSNSKGDRARVRKATSAIDASRRFVPLSRLNAQIPIADKVEYADEVLHNSGSLHDLEIQVDSFLHKLKKEAGWAWRLSWCFPPCVIFSAAWMITWRVIRRARRGRHRKRIK